MEKTTKKKVRKAILGVTSVALVAGVTSALTMAVLSDVETRVNTFVGDPALSLQLYEPEWDGIDQNGTDGQPKKPLDPNVSTYGKNMAKTYSPGKEIPKDPYLLNTSGSDEYVAMRVTYQVHCDNGFWHTVSPKDFKDYFAETQSTVVPGEAYNTDDWLLDSVNKDDCEYYYYMNSGAFTKLAKYTNEDIDDQTSALFDEVLPLDDLSKYTEQETGDWLMFDFDKESAQVGTQYEPFNYNGTDRKGKYLVDAVTSEQIRIIVGNTHGLPNFQILVEGAAIQTDNLDATDDAETIKEQLRSTFAPLESHPHS